MLKIVALLQSLKLEVGMQLNVFPRVRMTTQLNRHIYHQK